MTGKNQLYRKVARRKAAAERKEYYDGLSDQQKIDRNPGPKVLKKIVLRQLQNEGRAS